MPVSKKRKKPEKKKERDREPAAPQVAAEPASSGGLLSRMRGGIRQVAGAGQAKKKESLVSRILTWALVAVAAWFVAKRLGILP